ncbi:hypothetical protein L596_028192 [Steinernema carpocapsae]|uniref:C-type lectin domain-containing protein n=1 Tax=Steinernema carpocapsae TaxID=34508 RepID=A0A4U5LXP6_STECR|nr:hypothetical protein L596_028192 [Steinernema carpocapsae]
MFSLLCVVGFLFAAHCASDFVRYSRITPKIRTNETLEFLSVFNYTECASFAYKAKAIAFLYRYNTAIQCALIQHVDGFEANEDTEHSLYFIRDLREAENCGQDKGMKQLLHSQCNLKPSVPTILKNHETCVDEEHYLCFSLKRLHKQCLELETEDCLPASVMSHPSSKTKKTEDHINDSTDTTTTENATTTTTTTTTTATTTTFDYSKCEENDTTCCIPGFKYEKTSKKCFGVIGLNGTEANATAQQGIFGQCPSGSTSATIESTEQNDFIGMNNSCSLLNNNRAIIGLRIPEERLSEISVPIHPPYDPELVNARKKLFEWIVPSSTGYTNWRDNEPNNLVPNEFLVAVYPPFHFWQHQWDDVGLLDWYTNSIACMMPARVALG